MKRSLLILALPLLASCGTASPVPYTVVGKIDQGASITKFLVVNPGATRSDLKEIAGNACGQSRNYCHLLFWDSQAKAATGFPLSDQQVASQLGWYKVNRGNGYESLELQ